MGYICKSRKTNFLGPTLPWDPSLVSYIVAIFSPGQKSKVSHEKGGKYGNIYQLLFNFLSSQSKIV